MNDKPYKKPTHILKMKSKDPEDKLTNVIGVGWLEPSGRIAVQLKMGVSISWHDMKDNILSLFPNE